MRSVIVKVESEIAFGGARFIRNFGFPLSLPSGSDTIWNLKGLASARDSSVMSEFRVIAR